MGISRFCPRLVGKQVGFAPVAIPTAAGSGGVNLNISTGGGPPQDAGTEMSLMTPKEGTSATHQMRERSTSMSVKKVISTPKFSRMMIDKMSVEQRKAICESADLIRRKEGYRTYNTESEEEESEAETRNEREIQKKKVSFINASCRNCSKRVEACMCRAGVVPDWKRHLCVHCHRSEQYCNCEKFEAFPVLHPLA